MFIVTKEQQRAVEIFREQGNDIHDIRVYKIDRDLEKTLRCMSSKQIAAAWLGVAEIEPEYVNEGIKSERF